jgi:RND family efflux transporter MFP subunit
MKTNKLFILMFVLSVMFVSCGKSKTADKAAASDEKIRVKVVTVEKQEVDQNTNFTATVEPDVKNNIAPSAPGRIRKIFVEVGASVTKGQRLAQMDAANLSNLETQIENFRKNFKRVSELFAVGGASQQDMDNAKLQLDMAETNMKNMSENTYLLSPISGVVTARNYDEGDMYSGQMPVLTVMQINPVQLKINISESYYSKVKVGMPVDITVDVFGGQKFNGKISLIYPTIDDRTRTFTVEIKLANNNNKVRPGMFARANLNFGKENHVVVPDISIVKQSGSGTRYVYVYENGKVRMQQIELGSRLNDKFEILSGLNGNEQVVVSGQAKLVDGSEVEPVK